MKESVSGIVQMNLFGFPLVGADICGFNGETTEQLCTRWMQLGTFYPFSRNHNAHDKRSQEPWAFSQQHLDISRNFIENRYYLLPYYYTLLQAAHVNGETIARGLFFEFPQDVSVYGIDTQFLVGPALLVSPVFEYAQTYVTAYLPASSNDLWYDYWNGTQYVGGKSYHFHAPIETIPVHIRGGYIIPAQEPAMTTYQARSNPFALLVALDKTGGAIGNIYLDDGESIEVGTKYTTANYQVSTSSTFSKLNAVIANNQYAVSADLGTVKVYGVSFTPKQVTVDGQSHSSFTYNSNTKMLQITGLAVDMNSDFTITWST